MPAQSLCVPTMIIEGKRKQSPVFKIKKLIPQLQTLAWEQLIYTTDIEILWIILYTLCKHCGDLREIICTLRWVLGTFRFSLGKDISQQILTFGDNLVLGTPKRSPEGGLNQWNIAHAVFHFKISIQSCIILRTKQTNVKAGPFTLGKY